MRGIALCAALTIATLYSADLPRGAKYIGEYGDDGGVIYILERDGKLEALVKRTSYFPLTAISDTDFAFPASGFMEGKVLHFTDNGVDMSGVFIPRREVAAPGTTFK